MAYRAFCWTVCAFVLLLLSACSEKDVGPETLDAGADTAAAAVKATASSQTTNSNTTAVKADADSLPGTSWRLTAFETRDASALTESLVDIEVTASFSANGSVSGSNGCNRYRASVDVDSIGMSVGPIAGTKMACPGTRMQIEDAYVEALGKAERYRMLGDTLTLSGSDGQSLLRFTRSGTE